MSAVDWGTHKQSTISHSSTEAEIVSMFNGAKSVLHMKDLIEFMGVKQLGPIRTFVDNQTAMQMAKNPSISTKRRHMRVNYQVLLEYAEKGYIDLLWIPTADQLADIMTKPLGRQLFVPMRQKIMGLIPVDYDKPTLLTAPNIALFAGMMESESTTSTGARLSKLPNTKLMETSPTGLTTESTSSTKFTNTTKITIDQFKFTGYDTDDPTVLANPNDSVSVMHTNNTQHT